MYLLIKSCFGGFFGLVRRIEQKIKSLKKEKLFLMEKKPGRNLNCFFCSGNGKKTKLCDAELNNDRNQQCRSLVFFIYPELIYMAFFRFNVKHPVFPVIFHTHFNCEEGIKCCVKPLYVWCQPSDLQRGSALWNCDKLWAIR